MNKAANEELESDFKELELSDEDIIDAMQHIPATSISALRIFVPSIILLTVTPSSARLTEFEHAT